jgi:polysaccharide biosynthesis protein PslJ
MRRTAPVRPAGVVEAPIALLGVQLPVSPASDGGAAGLRPRADAATILVIFLILLIGIPSRLVIKQLGAQATPALLLGLGLLLWWACARMVPGLGLDRATQPMRVVTGLLAASVLASYGIGFLHHLEGVQTRGADRGILYYAGLMGVGLLAMDGISTRARLDRVLKTLVIMASISAALGILSFFFGWYPVNQIHIPGLSSSAPLTFIGGRSSFRRVAGTAQHPLEFGILMAMVLPIAMHYAFSTPKPANRRWWLCVILVGIALPMALSRAAIIGVIVALAVLFPTWPRPRRIRALALVPFYGGAMHLLVPGLIGTFSHLFIQAKGDDSITHRTYNYARIGSVMHHHWLFGTGGFGTAVPIRFDQVLDNAYLGYLFETGLIGLGCLLLLFWVGVFTARGARRRSADPTSRDLGQALAASVAVVIPGFFTFDAFGYSMAVGTLFLILGCCGAAWRLARVEQLSGLSRLKRSRHRLGSASSNDNRSRWPNAKTDRTDSDSVVGGWNNGNNGHKSIVGLGPDATPP